MTPFFLMKPIGIRLRIPIDGLLFYIKCYITAAFYRKTGFEIKFVGCQLDDGTGFRLMSECELETDVKAGVAERQDEVAADNIFSNGVVQYMAVGFVAVGIADPYPMVAVSYG